MADQLSFSNTFRALEGTISLAHQRHNLISGNISNLETPGYKAKDIDFKAAMASALSSEGSIGMAVTNPEHIGRQDGAAPEIEPFEESGEWNGFNYIAIDKVMTKMTENNLVYKTAAEILMRKIAILKEVIREGGR